MTKTQIKKLTAKQMQKLSMKWLLIIASKPQQFGKASDRAKAELDNRSIKYSF